MDIGRNNDVIIPFLFCGVFVGDISANSLRSSDAPGSKVHGANMGPTWVLSAPDGPHVGPMNLAIRGRVAK